MEIDWKSVEKLLVVRLRSIGDTVLATPTLTALRDFLPNAQIDVLLEDWVAPVLEGFPHADEILSVRNSGRDRTRVAFEIRKRKYDVAVNLHGGTSAGFLTRASGARHRIGYSGYQYSFLYNNSYPPPSEFWKRKVTHSAENQIALLGYAGVPVRPCPKTSLAVLDEARSKVLSMLKNSGVDSQNRTLALIHSGAAYETKRWAAKKYAAVIEFLEQRGMVPVIVFTDAEASIVQTIESALGKRANKYSGLSLPEVTALASISSLFVGNDSGIAHIAAAVGTPSVVVFGSSHRGQWSPWTYAPNAVVFNPLECQPCPGDKCRVYGEPRCIIGVTVDQVTDAIEMVLRK